MTGATSDVPENKRRSALDALIADKCPGMTVRDIERRAGLKEGNLGHYLKTPQRGEIPRLRVMERFAHALNTSITEVSRAFAADSRLALDDGPAPMTGEEIELLALFRRLDDTHRPMAVALVETVGRQQDATTKPAAGTG